jgi:hypothetical protein
MDDTSQPSASSGSVEVRALTAPTRAEIEQLAEIFDRYASTMAKLLTRHGQRVGWNGTSAAAAASKPS